MSDATWKPVDIDCRFTGCYEVSNLGQVRSLVGSNRLKSKRGSRFLSQTFVNGYKKVTLCKGDERRTIKVHVLVAHAFLGVRPNGAHINHIDGDKTNNRCGNLEYITHLQNLQHAKAMGLRKHVGKKCTATRHKNGTLGKKLTYEDAEKIRALVKSGKKMRHVGGLFGVVHQTVSAIVANKIWKEIPGIGE